MQCPKCKAAITAAPDAAGALVCPGCGARLLTRAAAAARVAVRPPEAASAGPEPPHPGATLPPGTPLRKIPARDEKAERAAGEGGGKEFEAILAELRALRSVQEEILELLRDGGRPERAEPAQERAGLPSLSLNDGDTPTFVAPIRTKRRKSVLLIDDDVQAQAALVSELERAAVPVRAYRDGQAGLQAIAAEKPDVIVLELELQGPMAGKDVINMIKATMEWVDIPIILYTRAAVESQREARTVHGADEFVLKSAGPAALVARCIAFFRKA
jgi:CheY-like chemotaxis protein